MAGGRPLKFSSVEVLDGKIQSYFDEVAEDYYKDSNGVIHQAPLTITGLALALDTTRQTLMDYQERDEFTDTIKRAKTVIENYAEKRLFGSNATGAIFALKNFGWKDTQDHNIGGQKDNPLLVDDAQRTARIAELLNKAGASGALGVTGVAKDTTGEEEPS